MAEEAEPEVAAEAPAEPEIAAKAARPEPVAEVEAAEPAADEPEVEPEPETVEAPAPTPGLASRPVVLVRELPESPPTQVGDQIGHDTVSQTKHRVHTWLAETKYFLSTLQHEVAGEHGELIAHLRERL